VGTMSLVARLSPGAAFFMSPGWVDESKSPAVVQAEAVRDIAVGTLSAPANIVDSVAEHGKDLGSITSSRRAR
jgi:hypothetical protein